MNRKDIFMSGFKSKLTYSFNHKDLAEFEIIINFYEGQIQKYKEVIDKALKINEKIIDMREQGFSYEQYKPYLLEQRKILKEVEHD